MDNKKIGKLIASLRKKQGLTQQDLGDKVGVGFRAVSKWERGLTLPDISIINELSKILGISSDELLSGELKKENKTKNKKKIPNSIKITISIVTLIIIVVTSLLVYNNNKTYVYDIKKIDGEDYYIEGKVTFQNKKLSIIVNKLEFRDQDFSSTTIKDYRYKIKTDDKYIFGYGHNPNGNNIEENVTIEEISKNFIINYDSESDYTRKEILENKLSIVFSFLTSEEKEIEKEIEIVLIAQKKNK